MWYKFCHEYDLNELNNLVKRDDSAKKFINIDSISAAPQEINVEFLPGNIYDLDREVNHYMTYVKLIGYYLHNNTIKPELHNKIYLIIRSLINLQETVNNYKAAIKEKEELYLEEDWSKTENLEQELNVKNQKYITEYALQFYNLSKEFSKAVKEMLPHLPESYRALISEEVLQNITPRF